jgi:hypothetical protein
LISYREGLVILFKSEGMQPLSDYKS